MAVAVETLRGIGADVVVYDEVLVEPTDVSFKEAIAFANEGAFVVGIDGCSPERSHIPNR